MQELFRTRIAKNATWIIVCKGIQAVLGLVVTMLTARLYGPGNYGAITYAASLTLFLTPVAQLGFTSTLVGELVAHPGDEGEILGSAIAASIVSGALCVLGIWTFTRLTLPGEPGTVLVCVVYSLSLLTQGAELIQYWFQAKLLSKYVAVLTLIAYALISAYQLVILLTGSNMALYAASKAIEYALIAAGLLAVYRRLGGGRLRASLKRGLALVKRGGYYLLSGLMVMLLGQTDRIMIVNMLGETEMGLYSAAVVGANLTEFVFLALIDSFRPSILVARERDTGAYETQMARLYAIVIYLALLQSAVVAIFAEPIIVLLYGQAYRESAGILRLLVWYSAFSYIGSARLIWIYAENKQRLLCLLNLLGALCNILLNWTLIPRWGVRGAAFASLVTQAFANVLLGWLLPQIRPNQAILMRAVRLCGLWSKK